MTPTKLTSVPIVVEIEKIEIVLSEKSRAQIPNTLGKLFKKPADSSSSSEDYGLKDKLGDGIQVKIKSIEVVVQLKGPNTGRELSSTSPPLFVLMLEDVHLRQTDHNWKPVENLADARRFGDQKDDIYIFRQLSFRISCYLVPCTHSDDPAAAILRGAKCKASFTH